MSDMESPITRLNVMVVDDEEGIREILCILLEGMGAQVWNAANGEEALQICERHPEKFDLVISDMRMPVMDGPSLLKSLKQKSINKPKFLLMSGDINLDLKGGDRVLGDMIDGYFPKPFSDESLRQALSDLRLRPSRPAV